MERGQKMKEIAKKTVSIFAASAMLAAALAGCASGKTPGSTVAGTSSVPAVSADIVYPAQPEELGSGTVKWAEEDTKDGWSKVTNEGGPTLGYTKSSGVAIIQLDGFAFKDLNKSGMLELYEDWRQDADARAADLAATLTADEAAGLIPHASQFNVDDTGEVAKPLIDMGIRSILSFATAFPVDVQAKWNNAIQLQAETAGKGIPINISTNPRTSPVWPDNLAQSATFDPELVFEVSKGLATDYRALGVTTLLGPQIDLASEPRWPRSAGTFGEDPALSRDLTDASVRGHQSTFSDSGEDMGWGTGSVNAMIKHWPGDGPGEGGRESHDWWGQFAVYPGGMFDAALVPFVDGGFNSTGKTGSATAVMSSYSAAWSEDGEYGELVGSAFSTYKIDLMRSYGFDGIICTDWGVSTPPEGGFSTGWGVEGDEATRSYIALMAGSDQIGGITNNVAPIKAAFEMGVEEHGEEFMLERFRESSRRIVKTFFLTGIFENPYVDVANAVSVVGGEAATKAGHDAQVKSIVMLKNADETIKAGTGTEKPTIYVPFAFTPTRISAMRGTTWAKAELPVDLATLEESFTVITDKLPETLTGEPDDKGNPTVAFKDIIRATKAELAECDYAFVIAQSPSNMSAGFTSGGYDPEADKFVPVSLQYGPYTADSDSVRKESIAGVMEASEVSNVYGTQNVKEKRDSNYVGNTSIMTNATELEMINYAIDNVPEDAKVVIALNCNTTMIVSEFEDRADAILMGYNINPKAFVDIFAGKAEPSGLLPIGVPKDMPAVEVQLEDVPRDLECYVDAAGNTYSFAYGLNYAGVIKDARTDKYNVEPIVTPANKPA